MKKRIAVLLTALMIFSLSACGKEEPSQETGGETFPMTVTDYLGTEMEFEAAPVVTLNREDINFNERECVVIGKGNKERLVYFDARTKIHLQNYLCRLYTS